MNGRLKFGFGALICFGFLAGDAGAAEPTAAGLAFFEKKIRPVLVQRCYKCHSAKSEKLKGGLLLDTRAGIRKGGESGHAVVPGNVREKWISQQKAKRAGHPAEAAGSAHTRPSSKPLIWPYTTIPRAACPWPRACIAKSWIRPRPARRLASPRSDRPSVGRQRKGR